MMMMMTGILLKKNTSGKHCFESSTCRLIPFCTSDMSLP